MNVVRVKPGCQFAPIAPGGFRILAALDTVARAAAVDLEITCGSEGHPPDDEHTRGIAYDVHVGGFTVDQVLDLRRRLQLELGPLFTVLYERPDAPPDPRLAVIAYINPHATAPHFHVQVKRGTVYPPAAAIAPTVTV
jgi:hypothetical protein